MTEPCENCGLEIHPNLPCAEVGGADRRLSPYYRIQDGWVLVEPGHWRRAEPQELMDQAMKESRDRQRQKSWKYRPSAKNFPG